jgi:transcriptional regulator with XRE-family HTH domain
MKKQMANIDSQQERTIFGQNLRRLRIQHRLRQRDLHLLTDIATSHVCDIEAGSCNIAIDTMVKLARVVKTPIWQMFKSHDGRATPRLLTLMSVKGNLLGGWIGNVC